MVFLPRIFCTWILNFAPKNEKIFSLVKFRRNCHDSRLRKFSPKFCRHFTRLLENLSGPFPGTSENISGPFPGTSDNLSGPFPGPPNNLSDPFMGHPRESFGPVFWATREPFGGHGYTFHWYSSPSQGEGTNYSFTSHTALHWAASKGHAATVRWLLAAGASATVTNASGATPLHAAADNQHVACIGVLMLMSRGMAMLNALQVSISALLSVTDFKTSTTFKESI